MSNVHIFENIGYQCQSSENIVLTKVLDGYQSLQLSNIDAYIPYLIRDKNQYEVGIGQLKKDIHYYIVRDKIISSSNDGKPVTIDNGKFFIFANEYNFNTAFHNVVVKNTNFKVDNIRAIYIVDASNQSEIRADLPPAADNESLIVDFKVINHSGAVLRIYENDTLIYSLKSDSGYVTLVSTGNNWISLQDNKGGASSRTMSISSQDFSTQEVHAEGALNSYQYNEDGTLVGGDIYHGPDHQLLFGSDILQNAYASIPTSGDFDTIFNQQHYLSDFYVYGSGDEQNVSYSHTGGLGINVPSGVGQPVSGDVIIYGNDSGNKNLFFSYDGRLGLNIPVGARPQTLAHFVNLNCQEGLRLENRTSCNTASMTFYHKPPIAQIPNNTDIATISLSSKNSDNNKIDYSRLSSRILDYDAASSKGQFSILVNSGQNLLETFTSNPNQTYLSAGISRISASPGGVGLSSSDIVFSGTNINFVGLDGTSGTINAANVNVAETLSVNELRLTTLPSTSILTINNGEVVSANQNNPISIIGAPSGRLLRTDVDGQIYTDIKVGDFFRTNNDVVYSAYPKRLAEGCLSQIIFDPDTQVPIEEYSIGDQISVEYVDGTILYTNIERMTATDDFVTVLFTTDQITSSTEGGLYIQSISKGFTLTLQKYVDPEVTTVNDSTAIVFSTRPYEHTVFNDAKKPIGFSVYSDADVPGLDIRPSEFRGNIITQGNYYQYATNSDTQPLKVEIVEGGTGNSNRFNTANYNASQSIAWSGYVTSVGTNGLPSHYGTYDQNGNVAEWLADNTQEHTSVDNMYIGGGSIMSSGSDFNAFQHSSPETYGSGIGFRIASNYALEDSSYITGILQLEFVDIQNAKNESHDSMISVDDGLGNISDVEIHDLGKVPYSYRMSTFEITNDQYAAFLNSVATGTDLFGLYHGEMATSYAGGIDKIGIEPSEYVVKADYGDKPVNFVDYLDCLRFTNWLHNGAPTGLTEPASNITENGAYNIINTVGNIYAIAKNPFARYYIPDIHEWYKSAYFEPLASVTAASNTVIINSDLPEPSAVLTIGGKTHIRGDLEASGISGTNITIVSADGHSLISTHSFEDGAVSILNEIDSMALVNSENGRLTIGPNPTLSLSAGNRFDGDYRTGFAPDKVTIAADGEIKIMSPEPVQFSGVQAQTIIFENLFVSDPDNPGETLDFFEGPSGGLLYKTGSASAKAIERLTYIEDEDEIYITGVSGLCPLYTDNLNYLQSYNEIEYNDDNILVKTLLKLEERDLLQIGDDSESLKGAILVHQGIGPLKFELNTYLEADGATYNRFPKRLVYFDSEDKRIKFVTPISEIGGIAQDVPTQEELDVEYSFGDTVAIMHTGDFEVEYVKLAAKLTGPFDGPDALYISHPPIFLENENNEFYTYACPNVLPNELDGGEDLPGFTGIMYSITKSATLTNGLGYGLFNQDPPAISGFSCDIDDPIENNPDAPFTFRPSSKYVLSTRPLIHTHFNAVGENIDFAVYGRTKFEYNRYYPEIHDADPLNGELPIGLTPVFKVDANIPNAISGSVTGMFFDGYIDAGNTIPTGYDFDQIGRAMVNMNNPYVLNSIRKAIDILPSGYDTLDYVADLSVNGYTYSSGIVTDHVYLSGMHESSYIPGAALTVDVNGKIISISPEVPPGPPGPPRNVQADPGNTAAFLSWLPPIDTGGEPIIDYDIEYSTNNGVTWTPYVDTVSAETEADVTGLTNEVNYVFRVAAINQIGKGQWSLSSNQVTPSSIFPGQVRNVSIDRQLVVPSTPVVDRMTVSWQAPESAGGSPITRYIVRYKKTTDGSYIERFIDPDSAVQSIYTDIINGIEPGPHYNIQIVAENSFGEGIPFTQISYGTDEPPAEPPAPPDPYDFGLLTFNGACNT